MSVPFVRYKGAHGLHSNDNGDVAKSGSNRSACIMHSKFLLLTRPQTLPGNPQPLNKISGIARPNCNAEFRDHLISARR